MKSPIITRDKIKIDIEDEIMSLAFKICTVLGTVIGVWAVSCLVTGLVRVGPVQLMKGYLTAITGY